MLELNRGTINDIRRELNRLFLTTHAFDARFNTDEGKSVEIIFKDNPQFFFYISQPKESGTWISVESPGQSFRTAEKYENRDFSSARGRISSWVQRVIEELTVHSTTPNQFIRTFRENLEQNADNLPEPELPFSLEESAEWARRLDEILQRFRKLEEDNKLHAGRLHQLERDFHELSLKLTVIPKKTWVKAAGNKILDFLETGAKEGLKTLVESTVKGLLSGKL